MTKRGSKITPEPWTYGVRRDGLIWISRGDPKTGAHYQADFPGTEKDAQLTVAAHILLLACKALEKAEEANANCNECDREGVPELCEKCFPLFDDARVLRRQAIEIAEGRAVRVIEQPNAKGKLKTNEALTFDFADGKETNEDVLADGVLYRRSG